MRAGRLDRLITIQRPTTTGSHSGEPQLSWVAIAGCQRRAASMAPVRGDERFTGEQIVGQEQVEFRIRYSAGVADISPKDRIIFPALGDNSPTNDPRTREIYDILAVHEIGRREGLRLITQRRADAT
jgi:head-tail adaptor